MILSPEIARCHGEQCEVREGCERWKQRASTGTETVHATTLRPAWQCFDELCDHAITTEEISDDSRELS